LGLGWDVGTGNTLAIMELKGLKGRGRGGGCWKPQEGVPRFLRIPVLRESVHTNPTPVEAGSVREKVENKTYNNGS